MTVTIKIITTPLAFNISVNCYLIRTDEGYIPIDTGMPNQRSAIEQELERAGCQPGTLKLIILTHGDSDHCGNAAYIRQKFGAKIAMHYDDSGMVERGDMSWNRQTSHNLIRILFGLFFSLSKSDRFKLLIFPGCDRLNLPSRDYLYIFDTLRSCALSKLISWVRYKRQGMPCLYLFFLP